MKPTKSHDGEMRFTIRVEQRVGRDWFIAFLSNHIANQLSHEELEEEAAALVSSKASFLAAVRKALTSDGSDYLMGWADELSAAEMSAISRLATVEIDKLFPELQNQESHVKEETNHA